ncbi:MAG TPA: chromosomal replication initiator protein DnaA [Solirubrobacteraceae bacterium]|nr:chromosomal replication initiator protein DnaA [Solirubrobacteraceae bacterium]
MSSPNLSQQEQVNSAVNAEIEHIWSRIAGGLAGAVDEPVFRMWLEPLVAVELSDSKLTVEAPPQSCGWVRERFGRTLQTTAAAVLGPDVTVDLLPAGQRSVAACPDPRAQNSERAERERVVAINPKLTFDQFVIGDSNRLAHAAALTVSELPAQAYNPLFICGPPGVGKTHLLRSIESFVAAHAPNLTVRSTTGEAFTNEFLQALTSSRLDSFKASFRQVDLLLLDDVQFLERKTRTEEEFFHTFNTLYEAGSQIVLSSDRPPSDLQALEDRLRERFQAGLVADIRPPDFPTRLAILRKRAQHDGIEQLDPLALEMIAQRVTANVRSLEGALIRVVAFSSLTGRPITTELAGEVLDGLYPANAMAKASSIGEVKLAVSKRYGLTTEELVSPGRASRISQPRQLAMYLARELTSESLPAIGREFGGRDHSTVLHALRRAEQRIQADPSYRAAAESLRDLLTSPSPDRRA